MRTPHHILTRTCTRALALMHAWVRVGTIAPIREPSAIHRTINNEFNTEPPHTSNNAIHNTEATHDEMH